MCVYVCVCVASVSMCVHAKYTCKSQRRISGIFLYYMPPYSLAAVFLHRTWAGNFRSLHTQHWRSGRDSLCRCRGSHSSLCRKHTPSLSHLPGNALPLSKCVFSIRKLRDVFYSAERLPHTVLQGTVGRKAAVHLIGQCEHQELRKASADRSAWQSQQSDTSKWAVRKCSFSQPTPL